MKPHGFDECPGERHARFWKAATFVTVAAFGFILVMILVA